MAGSDAELSSGLLAPPAAAVGLVASVGLGAVAPVHAWWALAVLIVGCSMTATIGPARTALLIGLSWALCADGFVAHRHGNLGPLGTDDLVWLAAFLGAALLGAWCRLPRRLVADYVEAALGGDADEEESSTALP